MANYYISSANDNTSILAILYYYTCKYYAPCIAIIFESTVITLRACLVLANVCQWREAISTSCHQLISIIYCIDKD